MAREQYGNHDHSALANEDMKVLVTQLFNGRSFLINNGEMLPIFPLDETLEQSNDSRYRAIVDIDKNTRDAFGRIREEINGACILVAGIVAGANLGGGGHYYLLALQVAPDGQNIEELTLYNAADWHSNLDHHEIDENLKAYTNDVLAHSGFGNRNIRYVYKQPYLQATDSGCGYTALAGAYDDLIGCVAADSRKLTIEEDTVLRGQLLDIKNGTSLNIERFFAEESYRDEAIQEAAPVLEKQGDIDPVERQSSDSFWQEKTRRQESKKGCCIVM